jgi:hypothetical protein
MKWLVFLTLSLHAQLTPEALLGRWRSEAVSEGGIGTTLEFRDGGSLRVGTGAVVASSYTIDGTELVQPGPNKGGPPTRLVIDLREAGVLRLWDGKRMISEWRRVGPPAAGLLGEWSGKQEMAGFVLNPRFIFYEQGQSLFVMPFRTKMGRWQVTGANIDVTWPNGARAIGAFTVREHILTLPASPGGEATRFYRY